MVKLPRWTAAALALAAAACGGGGGGGGGGAGPTPIDCAWLAAENCWKASAAAATACTDGAAAGTLDEATTTCSYADGTTILFDPSTSVTANLQRLLQHERTLWDFTVLTSTATTCARYVDTATSQTLTTGLGTFSLQWATVPAVLTCPDGSSFTLSQELEWCASNLLGWWVRYGYTPGTTEFFLNGAPPTDGLVWRCH